MKHESILIKFLRKVIRRSRREDEDVSPFSGWFSGRIPEELLPPEMEPSNLEISGQEYCDFDSVFHQLRNDRSTEYLSDKELKDRLWYILCDVFVNRDSYTKNSKLKEKVRQFLSKLCRPLEEFEVMFKVYSFEVTERTINFWDCSITRFDRSELNAWGLDPSKDALKRAISEFENQTLMIVKESGNEQKLVVERARKKATIRLKALQTYLSDFSFLYDEKLLFELSEFAVIRKAKDPNLVGWNWTRKRSPDVFKYNEKFENFLIKGDQQLQSIKSLSSEMQVRIERAIFWIGKSIDEAEPDQKIIALCTAMETLLTAKSDRKKGEAIAYRMVLLNSLLKERFLTPAKILWIYELRSKIIHGSDIAEATMSEYHTMLLAAKQTLYNFIKFVNKGKTVKLSQFVKILETSENAELVIKWLENFNDEYSKAIKVALKEAISKE